jgi:hypothetical protein
MLADLLPEKVATKWDKMVLILVLLEYARRQTPSMNETASFVHSLNPCFTGICSPTKNKMKEVENKYVLILVLLEYARRRAQGNHPKLAAK